LTGPSLGITRPKPLSDKDPLLPLPKFPPSSKAGFRENMFAFTILSALLLAGQACTSSIVGRSTITGLLQARQSGGPDPSGFPAPCQNACDPTAAILDSPTCTTPSCYCTSQVNSGLQGCLNCVLDLEGNDPSDVIDSQVILAGFEDDCKKAGFPLASLSVDGATPVSTTAPTVASSTPDAGGGDLPTTTTPQTTRSGSPTGAGAPLPSASGAVGNGAVSASFNSCSAIVLSGILTVVVMVLRL